MALLPAGWNSKSRPEKGDVTRRSAAAATTPVASRPTGRYTAPAATKTAAHKVSAPAPSRFESASTAARQPNPAPARSAA